MPQITVIGIDDDGYCRTLISLAARRLSRQLGQPITTHVTYSSAEAIQLLREQERDTEILVVLDLNLPGDVDGRLLGSYIREQFPQTTVLPFTGDSSPKTMNVIRLNGMHDPVVKPASADMLAKRMAATLQAQTPESDTLLLAYHADLARQMATMVRREGAQRAIQVALLAHKHVVLAGLKQILAGVSETVDVAVSVPTGRRDLVIVAARQGKVDLLVCDPEDLDDALVIVQSHGVPLLVYASLCDAPEVLGRGHSLVVEPASSAQWAEAIQATLRGDRYRPRQLEAALALAPRDCSILKLLRGGISSAKIAARLAITEERLRQRISNLYRQLNLPATRSALQAWAQQVPEEWLDELAEA